MLRSNKKSVLQEHLRWYFLLIFDYTTRIYLKNPPVNDNKKTSAKNENI